MQHAEAIRSMTSEKYLLDELTPELREEFEEHFFGCPECALDVRAGTAFLEQTKTALAEPAQAERSGPVPIPQPQGWLAWLRPAIAVPVLALLLVIIGYQSFVAIPTAENENADLRSPQILPSASLVSARSDRVPVIAVHPNQSFLLFVDIPTDGRFTSYVCELYSPSGALVWSLPVSTDAAKNTLPLHVPSGHAVSGVYTLTVGGIVTGADHTVLARYPFELQPQQ
jgi:hypothetical protein